MNSYAPIFANENDYNWKPDMIRFNTHRCYGTPSYYVQQLFPNNVGTQNVVWTESGNCAGSSGGSASPAGARKVYVAASIDDDEGLLYVKLVNPSGDARQLRLNLSNCTPTGGSAITLASASDLDENTPENPYNVVPTTGDLVISGSSLDFDMPAYALCILRINVENITMDK